MQVDPELKILLDQEKVAKQQIKLSKNKSLPNLTAGYNYQGVSGSTYSGIYGGVSSLYGVAEIPLRQQKQNMITRNHLPRLKQM